MLSRRAALPFGSVSEAEACLSFESFTRLPKGHCSTWQIRFYTFLMCLMGISQHLLSCIRFDQCRLIWLSSALYLAGLSRAVVMARTLPAEDLQGQLWHLNFGGKVTTGGTTPRIKVGCLTHRSPLALCHCCTCRDVSPKV